MPGEAKQQKFNSQEATETNSTIYNNKHNNTEDHFSDISNSNEEVELNDSTHLLEM